MSCIKTMALNTEVTCKIFKDGTDFGRYSCLKCGHLLADPVQLGCGHRLCRSCADKLIANQTTPKCPDAKCNEDIDDEDGAYVRGLIHKTTFSTDVVGRAVDNSITDAIIRVYMCDV